MTLSAQYSKLSENELSTLAEKSFLSEDFATSKEMYSQLHSLYPNKAFYGYRYGICMLYQNIEKGDALEYLIKASEDASIEPKVHFYIGAAYHYNYQFDKAIESYTTYEGFLKESDKNEIRRVHRAVEMCENGKELLRYIHGLKVHGKKEIPKKIFFRAFKLDDRDDGIFAMPDYLKSKIDKKKNEYSLIFKSDTTNSIYFSSYGKTGENGKDIYKILRLPNGKWSEPENIGSPVNTQYNEDFPYFHSDGKTLYFCSEGHNSMGQYDIFKATYDQQTNTWSNVTNMDFPINSPGDDVFYMPEPKNKFAFFASDRSSAYSDIWAYQIEIPKEPKPFTIIKGIFKLEDSLKYKQATLTVKDFYTNEIVSVFKTNTEDPKGKYLMILPPDDYRLEVEHPGYEKKTTLLTIPVQTELTSLNQEIVYGDDIKIINSYKIPRKTDYLSTIDFIKSQAKLEINAGKNFETTRDSSKVDSIKQAIKDQTIATRENIIHEDSKVKQKIEIKSESKVQDNNLTSKSEDSKPINENINKTEIKHTSNTIKEATITKSANNSTKETSNTKISTNTAQQNKTNQPVSKTTQTKTETIEKPKIENAPEKKIMDFGKVKFSTSEIKVTDIESIKTIAGCGMILRQNSQVEVILTTYIKESSQQEKAKTQLIYLQKQLIEKYLIPKNRIYFDINIDNSKESNIIWIQLSY